MDLAGYRRMGPTALGAVECLTRRRRCTNRHCEHRAECRELRPLLRRMAGGRRSVMVLADAAVMFEIVD